jgi:5-methylthioadenosine/S-adenosylhomocysteine deaminase
MPHSTYTDSPEHLAEIAQLASELKASIHLHVSETRAENLDVASRYQHTPVEILQRSGILESHTIYGHGVHLSDSDIAITAKAGGAVAHCPGSNMKLGSGLADIKRLQEGGVKVGIGTDGCSSSNDLDMWQAMRMAAHVAAITRSPAEVDAATIFRMATIEAARAIGIDAQVGSIEPGKLADFIVIDHEKPHLTPIHDIFALLIFAAGRGDVRETWIDGKPVVLDGIATQVDAREIMRRSRERVRVLETL